MPDDRIQQHVGSAIEDDVPVFWVGPEAILVDEEGTAFLDKYAATHPYRNSYQAPIRVNREAETGRIVLDITMGFGKWIKHPVPASRKVPVDVLVGE
jgi:hypothetical protein